jgi:hypothetical protein
MQVFFEFFPLNPALEIGWTGKRSQKRDRLEEVRADSGGVRYDEGIQFQTIARLASRR